MAPQSETLGGITATAAYAAVMSATAVSNAVKTHIKSTGQHVGTVDVGEEDGDGNPVLHQCHHLEDGMFHPGQLNFSGLKYNYAVCCDMGICSPFSSPLGFAGLAAVLPLHFLWQLPLRP